MIQALRSAFHRLDPHIAAWMSKHGIAFLRYTLAIIFIWFGALKPLGISPAAELVKNTVYWFNGDDFLVILGVWEVLIGVFLVVPKMTRAAILLLFLQMPGTMLPLVLLPEVCFTDFPYGLTLEGQYIIKNLILISAGIVVGGTVRER
ncbi:MAG: hypothetical protein CL946_01990 [Ectothiorhodospiraceae bacterium]|nr:hypothetical protein [Ectothiorhodospiraceae bacterium]